MIDILQIYCELTMFATASGYPHRIWERGNLPADFFFFGGGVANFKRKFISG